MTGIRTAVAWGWGWIMGGMRKVEGGYKCYLGIHTHQK